MKHLQKLEELAVKTFNETGQHLPQLMYYGKKGSAIVVIPELNPNQKHEMMKAVGFKFGSMINDNKLGELEEMYFVSEAWMATVKKDDISNIPPSEHPDRQEILLISGVEYPSNIQLTQSWLIKRKGKKVSLEKQKTLMKAESYLIDIFIQGYKVGVDRAKKAN